MLNVQYEFSIIGCVRNEVIGFVEVVRWTGIRVASPVAAGTLFWAKAITDLICTVFN